MVWDWTPDTLARLQAFLGERSGARFSHTFCEECGRKHYGALAD